MSKFISSKGWKGSKAGNISWRIYFISSSKIRKGSGFHFGNKSRCFYKIVSTCCSQTRYWSQGLQPVQLIQAICTTNDKAAHTQRFSNVSHKGKNVVDITAQNGSVLTHPAPLWTCHDTFVSQMSSYIQFSCTPYLPDFARMSKSNQIYDKA